MEIDLRQVVKIIGNDILAKVSEKDLDYDLSLIVPTRNEAANILFLLTRIEQTLTDYSVEVIFVDDSNDETPEVIKKVSSSFPSLNVQLIHRSIEMRSGGLGTAVLLGMKSSNSEWICVMDADLQHPPELIPDLMRSAQGRQLDLVAASRMNSESELEGLDTFRKLISKTLGKAAQSLFSKQLSGIRDPLTGFFLLRRPAVDLENLHPQGFKILLEILVRNPDLKKGEIPFHFGLRYGGKSKASIMEVIRYGKLLLGLRFGSGSQRFVGFGLVGLSGILVNSLALALSTQLFGIHYLASAAIASVSSTTWNFLLSEFFVFQSGSGKGSKLQRFGLFFALNQIALLFRTPMIYGLTEILGMHYLLSNLLSLFSLTLLRFVVADGWIWGRRKIEVEDLIKTPTTAGRVQVPSPRRKKMGQIFYYSLHNVITLRSDVSLPELEPFLVEDEIDQPDILVSIGRPTIALSSQAPSGKKIRHLTFREIFGRYGFEIGITIGDQIELVASPLLRYSPHVLYTNVVEPVLRWAFVERGYALVHGATIAFMDRAYMITARTDTGKTTTLLQILKHQRRRTDKMAFISDDMTLITPKGEVLSYPKPLTISYHTLKSIERNVLTVSERIALVFQSRLHSRSGRIAATALGKTRLPMATINTIVQLLVPPPKYPVQRLLPKVKFANPSRLKGIFVIERGQDERVEKIPGQESLEILLANCEDAYGFPPYHSIKEFLYTSENTDLRVAEKEIIQSALGNIPALSVRSNRLEWWRRIPAFVDHELELVFPSRLPDTSNALTMELERI